MLLVHIRPSLFQIDWQPIFIWLLPCVEQYWRKSTYLSSSLHTWAVFASRNNGHQRKHTSHLKLDLRIRTFGFWEEFIVLKWVIVSLKVNSFRKPRIAVIASSQWQVFVISIFWIIWGKTTLIPEAAELEGGEGGLRLHTRNTASFFKVAFYWQVFIGE